MTPMPDRSPNESAPSFRPRCGWRTSTLILTIAGVGLLCLLTISIFRNVVIFDIGHRNDGERETAAQIMNGALRIDSVQYSDPKVRDTTSGFIIPFVVGVLWFEGSPEGGYGAAGPKSPPETGWKCVINLWPVALALLIVPGLRLRKARRRAMRRLKGLCVQCGYDLRGNVSDTCPECGQQCDPADRAPWLPVLARIDAARVARYTQSAKIAGLVILLILLGVSIYYALLFTMFHGWLTAVPGANLLTQQRLSCLGFGVAGVAFVL